MASGYGQEADRAEALMRQRMQAANNPPRQIPMGQYPMGQQPMGQPPMGQMRAPAGPPPGMGVAQARPPPAGSMGAQQPPLTGNTRRIPLRSDPVNSVRPLMERNSGSALEGVWGSSSSAVTALVYGVAFIVGAGVLFVLPRQLQVFWVLCVGLSLMAHAGVYLYAALMSRAEKGEDSKYSEWAWMLLYAITMLYSGVIVGVLVFMGWSLYTFANTRTNLIRNDAAGGQWAPQQQTAREVYI